MAIEDVLGRPQPMHDGSLGPGPLDHGPDEWCAGRAYGMEPSIDITWEGEIDGESLLVKLCTACGKTWYERSD